MAESVCQTQGNEYSDTEAEQGRKKAYLTRASFRRAFCSSSCLSW